VGQGFRRGFKSLANWMAVNPRAPQPYQRWGRVG
jgi:hypothetical protein